MLTLEILETTGVTIPYKKHTISGDKKHVLLQKKKSDRHLVLRVDCVRKKRASWRLTDNLIASKISLQNHFSLEVNSEKKRPNQQEFKKKRLRQKEFVQHRLTAAEKTAYPYRNF